MDEWLSELNKHVREALPAELPSLIGALEQLKALMLVRLTQRVGSFVPQKDYTAGELAAHLKVPKGTVYRLYRDGGVAPRLQGRTHEGLAHPFFGRRGVAN